MNAKTLLWTLAKLLLGGLAFVAGSILGGMVAAWVGIPLPTMPPGIDPAQVAQTMPLVGVMMAAVLGLLARHSGVGFLPRWILLSLFSWTAYGLNNYLESRFFMPDMATSYVLVTSFIACWACAGVAAWLFKPEQAAPFGSKARTFLTGRPAAAWSGRLLAGLASFPAAYFFFGRLVAPFVLPYYEQQYAGLALPGLDVMLVLSSTRSLLFLLSIFPLLIAWNGSRTRLFLSLGTALFLLVGGLAMLQAIWLPGSLRLAHSLEMLAGSLVHAAALVFLLVPAARAARKLPVLSRRVEA